LCEDKTEIDGIHVFRQTTVEGGEDCFADRGAVIQDVVVPETENGIACRAHEFIATAVVSAIRVLATIDFNDEFRFAAAEVGEVGADGILTGEFVSAEFTALEFKPKQSLGLIVPLPQITRAFSRADSSATTAF
jgi:hypothetical protein